VAALPGKRVIVVCHGGLINAVLARISHGEIGTGITLIQNTARTTILRDNRGWTVTEVAVADHLDMAAVAD
jgi:broad specificity phosphatase PhoE